LCLAGLVIGNAIRARSYVQIAAAP
jgi:hypothetical protein